MVAYDFFIKELRKLPVDRLLTIKGRQATLRCPIHKGGLERTPSLGVLLEAKARAAAGSFNCLGCGAKGGWNALCDLFPVLRKLNAKELGIGTEDRQVFVPPDEDGDQLTLPNPELLMQWPDGLPWRGIPAETMRHYNVRLVNWLGQPSGYLPVTAYDEQIGAIFLKMERQSKAEKAYLNLTGAWASRTVLGFDQAMAMAGEPLWVAEGPRDVMHLASHGARVVGLIGAAVTKGKLRMIMDLDPPVVLCATDADEAGDIAAQTLRSALRRAGLPYKRVVMPEGTDPVDLKPKQIKAIVNAIHVG